MGQSQDRRQFLVALGRTALAAGIAAGASARTGLAQPSGPARPPADSRGAVSGNAPAGGLDLAPSALREGLWLIQNAGANVVALETSTGPVLVDSGAPAQAESLVALLDARFGQNVPLLFSTRWHLDHTGGHDLLGRRGARIVAHENTRLWMSTEFYIDWQDRTYPPRAAEARPTDTFYSHEPQPIERVVGGLRIEYGHLKQARTDGDLYVRFPDLDVIVAGGAVTGYEYPTLDYVTGGWIGGLAEATAKLEALAGEGTLIVPARGAALRRSDLAAQRVMLETVRQRMEELALQGKGASEIAGEGVTAQFDGRWRGDPRLFVKTAYEGLWWADRLRGRVA